MPRRGTLPLVVALIAWPTGCGRDVAPVESSPPPQSPPAVAGEFTPQKPEFLEMARRLESGWNPYLGQARLAQLRAKFDGALPRALEKRLELLIEYTRELLRVGDVSGAEAAIESAFEAAGRTPEELWRFPELYRVRGLVHLRRAEVDNCIGRHNRECCIFPLAGGGVHELDEPVRRAHADYRDYLRIRPRDLTVRWLLNLTAMAMAEYPQAVPPELLIPPQAFESDHDIGRYVNVAPDLGVDTFNNAGGAVIDDVDGDGRMDIITTTVDAEGPVVYYRHAGDGVFQDLSTESRLDDQLGALNCSPADYDNDGDLDLLLLRGAWLFDDGIMRNSLLRNDDGVFLDVTRFAGVAEPAAPTQVAIWGDFDLDGNLDLYVPNEARPADTTGGDFGAQLFMSDGRGRFTDHAVAAGVTNDRYAKGVAAGDYDDDGDLDIYVSNIGDNRLYRNEGLVDGRITFTDVARSTGVIGPDRSFATWFFDYDNDGDLDLFVAAYDTVLAAVAADRLGLKYDAEHPALYRNDGRGRFTDVASEVGLDHPWAPMGASFGDLDNDGFLDIYLATGDPYLETLMPNEMLRNDAGRVFQSVTTSGGFGHLQKGHGIVFADIDDDGDQDIYEQLGGFFAGDEFRNALFENPGHGGRFLYIHLHGTETNRSGFGTRIAVTVANADGSTRTVHRAVGSVSSFGGTPRRQEIGLGADATRIERVEIRWPVSGERRVLAGDDAPPLDACIEITEGRAGYAAVELHPVELGETPARP